MSPSDVSRSEIRRSSGVARRGETQESLVKATNSPPDRGVARAGEVWNIERRLAHRILRSLGEPPLRLVLWNGEEIVSSPVAAIARIVFHDRAAFWKVVLDPDFQFGETYSAGRVEVEGDVVGFLETVHRHSRTIGYCEGLLPRTMLRRFHRARANSLGGARDNIHHHYDLGEDFYRLWLDHDMVYSGAYFPSFAMTLEDAQQAKMDYVCRKLWLTPGETVVEVGGGWGGLALFMARHYGVHVRSFNISRSQLDFAHRRAKDEGLDGQVEFIEDDYRNIEGRYDALVSLGMLEHVGVEHYRDFGRMADRCLTTSGRGLIQSIGQDKEGSTNPWIERRIFPGAYPPTLRQMAEIFEPCGFSVLDVENLRMHYAKTLRHWLQRFEVSADRVTAMFDDRFVRMWRLYLAGSCAAFTAGGLQLFQVTFARAGVNDIPWTRSRLHEHETLAAT